jgi:hypothetical protein
MSKKDDPPRKTSYKVRPSAPSLRPEAFDCLALASKLRSFFFFAATTSCSTMTDQCPLSVFLSQEHNEYFVAAFLSLCLFFTLVKSGDIFLTKLSRAIRVTVFLIAIPHSLMYSL